MSYSPLFILNHCEAKNKNREREIRSTHTARIWPTLRSVNDGKEHGPFMEMLEASIRNHDREIVQLSFVRDLWTPK